jgi:hypothetical protein
LSQQKGDYSLGRGSNVSRMKKMVHDLKRKDRKADRQTDRQTDKEESEQAAKARVDIIYLFTKTLE